MDVDLGCPALHHDHIRYPLFALFHGRRFSVGVTKSGFMSGTLAIIVTGPSTTIGGGAAAVTSGCKIDQYRITGYSASSIIPVGHT